MRGFKKEKLEKTVQTMDRYDWEATIKINVLLLKVAGLWPKGNETYRLNTYTVYMIISFALFQTLHTSTQVINLFFIYDDLEALTGTIFVLLTKVLAVLKSCCFIKNMKTLKELMEIVKSDIFQPKNSEQRNIADTNSKFWKFIFVYFWCSSIGALTFWTIHPIFSGAFKQYRLPFFAWYPYDVKKSPVYELTYVYQIFCTGFLIMANVDMDTLIAALNMYAGTQLDILCDNLRKLSSSEKEPHLKLIQCITHHKKIVAFADTISEFINWISLLQFFTGAVSIGFSMFQLTLTAPFSSEFYSFVFYGVAITCEIFIYCWFGNEVIINSSKLLYSAFESEWTRTFVTDQKELIIFMANAQRPLQVSAFGLFSLSLDTFMKILKSAWSYFALLKSVGSDD